MERVGDCMRKLVRIKFKIIKTFLSHKTESRLVKFFSKSPVNAQILHKLQIMDRNSPQAKNHINHNKIRKSLKIKKSFWGVGLSARALLTLVFFFPMLLACSLQICCPKQCHCSYILLTFHQLARV